MFYRRGKLATAEQIEAGSRSIKFVPKVHRISQKWGNYTCYSCESCVTFSDVQGRMKKAIARHEFRPPHDTVVDSAFNATNVAFEKFRNTGKSLGVALMTKYRLETGTMLE